MFSRPRKVYHKMTMTPEEKQALIERVFEVVPPVGQKIRELGNR